MTDGLSEANAAADYTRDPVFGVCNACKQSFCRCGQDRIDALEASLKRGNDNLSTLLLTIDHATAFQWGEYEARHSSGDAWAVYLVRPAGRDGLNGSRLEQAGLTRENAMTLAKSLGKSAPLSQRRDGTPGKE